MLTAPIFEVLPMDEVWPAVLGADRAWPPSPGALRGWSRLGVVYPAHAGAAVTSRTWFCWGDPRQVVVGVGDVDVFVSPAGFDVTRFDPDAAPAARVVPRETARLQEAVSTAATEERAARSWCASCGRFLAPAARDECLNCWCLRTGTII